jgi:hypothetical protein
VDIRTLRLPDGNFGGLYTDSEKDVNPDGWFRGPRELSI